MCELLSKLSKFTKRQLLPLRQPKVTILIILDVWQVPLTTRFWQVLHYFCNLWQVLLKSGRVSSKFCETCQSKIVIFGRLSGIFTQNGPRWKMLTFWLKIDVILWICSVLQKDHTTVVSVSAWLGTQIWVKWVSQFYRKIRPEFIRHVFQGLHVTSSKGRGAPIQ